jgi:hypothetical protein
MEVTMTSYFRPACLALGLVATAAPASAQTWTYEPDNRAPVYGQRVYEPGYQPQVYQPQVYEPRVYEPRAYESRAYEPAARVVVTQPPALTQAQRTTIYRTIIPQGRGRGPIVRERIVTETAAPVVRPRVVVRAAAVDAYAYAPAPRVVTRPIVYDYPRAEAYGAYAYAPAPVVAPRVIARPVVYDYPRAEAYGAYAYAPGPVVAQPVVTVVPAYRYVNPLAVNPITGVFLTDE